jgi:membrane fusion protein, multidrug efflux system
MRKRILVIIVIVFIVGLIAWPKVRPLLSNSEAVATEVPQRRALNVQARVIAPEFLSEQINSTGTLLADEEVELTFETSGKIVSINFQEGAKVNKGQLLAKINDQPLQAQLKRLMAQHQLATDREFRQRTLLSRDAISQESYDQAVTEMQALQADIMLIQARIAETELRAPFDGVIGLRYVSEGAFASSNTRIARLIKDTPLKLEFSIPERYSRQITPGFPVRFVVDGIAEAFEAKVYAVSPGVDIRTRTITVRALYPNTSHELNPGRFATLSLQLSETPDAIAVPTESIIPEMDGETVFVYRSGRAQKISVRTGLRTEASIQIIEGLSFGDTLLTTGVMQLRHGMPVVLDNLVEPGSHEAVYSQSEEN